MTTRSGLATRQAGVERLLQQRDPLGKVGAGLRPVQDPVCPALGAVDGILKTEIETVAHVGVLPGAKVEADRAEVAVEGQAARLQPLPAFLTAGDNAVVALARHAQPIEQGSDRCRTTRGVGQELHLYPRA